MIYVPPVYAETNDIKFNVVLVQTDLVTQETTVTNKNPFTMNHPGSGTFMEKTGFDEIWEPEYSATRVFNIEEWISLNGAHGIQTLLSEERLVAVASVDMLRAQVIKLSRGTTFKGNMDKEQPLHDIYKQPASYIRSDSELNIVDRDKNIFCSFDSFDEQELTGRQYKLHSIMELKEEDFTRYTRADFDRRGLNDITSTYKQADLHTYIPKYEGEMNLSGVHCIGNVGNFPNGCHSVLVTYKQYDKTNNHFVSSGHVLSFVALKDSAKVISPITSVYKIDGVYSLDKYVQIQSKPMRFKMGVDVTKETGSYKYTINASVDSETIPFVLTETGPDIADVALQGHISVFSEEIGKRIKVGTIDSKDKELAHKSSSMIKTLVFEIMTNSHGVYSYVYVHLV